MGIFRRKHNAPAPRVADQIMTYAEPVRNQDGSISFKLKNDDQNQMAIVPQLHAISQNASLPERLFKARQAKRIMWEIQQKAKNMKNSDINYSNPKVKVEPKKQEESAGGAPGTKGKQYKSGDAEQLPMTTEDIMADQRFMIDENGHFIPTSQPMPEYGYGNEGFSTENMGVISPQFAIPGITGSVYANAMAHGSNPKVSDNIWGNIWNTMTDDATAGVGNTSEFLTDEYWRRRYEYYLNQYKNAGDEDAENKASDAVYTEKLGGTAGQKYSGWNKVGRNAAGVYEFFTNPVNKRGFDAADLLDMFSGLSSHISTDKTLTDANLLRGMSGLMSLFGYGPEAEKDNK